MGYLKISHTGLISILFGIFFINIQVEASINLYPKLKAYPLGDNEDVGKPLFLTPLIESGQYDEAKKQATVQHKDMLDVRSYAGYLTVNKNYNSNIFFWFFPAQKQSRNAPVVLWLQGGPGATSLFGLFTENGPFRVTQNITLAMREYSWSISHNVIYIDNPVGTGYSFTDHDDGYATNETQIGADLHEALTQFFQLFFELQGNDFFVTGESYAGKYVPALSYTIHEKNPSANVKINLKGLAIGNGLTDPINQFNYGDYLYQIGLIDSNGRKQFHDLEAQYVAYLNQGKYDEAFGIFNRLMDGDSSGSGVFEALTGFNFYLNYLHTKDDDESHWMSKWIQRADVRKAMHVGNCTFHASSGKVEKHLENDFTRSQADKISTLVQHYKVLIYNGQLDIIVAYPLTENYLSKLQWPGADEYKKATRKIWRVDGEVAGYAKVVRNLTEVLVRNAGHMAPSDQPEWVLDLITRFTHDKSF